MDIKELLSLFGKEKVLEWVFDTLNFYLRPTKYFAKFFKKENQEKFYIAFFYSALLVIILYIFSERPILQLTKAILIEVAILIFAFGIISSNRFCLGKIFKVETIYSDVFYFLWLTKILTMPLQMVFFALFQITEMYELLFLHNSILILVLIFVLFYSNKIFYKKINQIISGIIYNFIIFNLFVFLTSELKFDNHHFKMEAPILTDYVYNEFENKFSNLDSLTYRFPTGKFLIKLDDKIFIVYSFEDESIPSVVSNLDSLTKNSSSFENDVNRKLSINKITTDSFEFNRNRELYSDLIVYLKTLSLEINEPIDTSDSSIIEKEILVDQYGNNVGEIMRLTTNNKLAESFLIYLKKRNSFISASNIAYYPLHIFSFVFYPAMKLTTK